MTKRQQFQLLTYSAIALLGSLYLRGWVPGFYAWEVRVLPKGLPFDGTFWIPIGLALPLLLASRLVWRCRHCGAFPGPTTAVLCRACGKVLDENTLPSDPINDGPPELSRLKVEELHRVLRRLIWVERMGGWRRSIPASMLVAITAGLVVRIYTRADRETWAWTGLAVVVTTPVCWILIHELMGMVKNLMLVSLRCPGCAKSLVNQLADFCPYCGVRVPPLEPVLLDG